MRSFPKKMSNLTILKEHRKVYRQIQHRTFLHHLGTIGQHNPFCVLVRFKQVVYCAMNPVVPAGLHLYRDNGQRIKIVDQEVHFALMPIIVVKEFLPMSLQFLCNNSFINRPKINAGDIVQHRRNIRTVQHSGKDADVIKIQFQQVLGRRLDQGELDICYCGNFKRNTRIRQVLKCVSLTSPILFPANMLKHK